MSLVRPFLAVVAFGVPVLLPGADQEDPVVKELMSLQSPWNLSGSFSGAVGYNDNVLLSSVGPQGSPQLRAEADMLAWRLPKGIADFVWFTSTSATLFTAIHKEGRTEASALSRAEYRYLIPGFFKASLSATGSYMDQVLDLSETSAYTLRLKARNTLLKLAPSLYWKPLHSNWIEIETSLQASRYAGLPEDSNEVTAQLRLGTDFLGSQSAGIRLAWLGQRYLERNQYTRGGRALKGTHLSLERPEAGLFWKSCWGPQRRLSTELDAGLAWNRDNGSGFFDHDRAQASLKLIYKHPSCGLSLRASTWRSLYGVQVAGEGFDPPRRRIAQTSLSARVERPCGHDWTLFAELEAERSSDNTPGGDYRAKGFLLGAEYAW